MPTLPALYITGKLESSFGKLIIDLSTTNLLPKWKQYS